MSTKIFNALRALHSTDPFEVSQTIVAQTHQHLLKKIANVAKELITHRHTITLWGEHMDFQTVDPENIAPIDWLHLHRELPKMIIQLHNTPFHTFSCADVLGEVTLLPSRFDDSVLILTFGAASHELYQLLIDTDIAEDYHYQNQTDPPEELDGTQAWQDRKRAWADIDQRGLSPAEIGLSVPQITAGQMTSAIFDATYTTLQEDIHPRTTS